MADFWHEHGFIFLLFMAVFPRITMLIATGATFTVWNWFGWLVAPRITAAILATSYYWHTNTALCIIAWAFAFYFHDLQIRQYGRQMRFRYHRTVIYLRHKFF